MNAIIMPHTDDERHTSDNDENHYHVYRNNICW